MKQEYRGGARQGAGRKAKDPNEKRVELVLSVDKDTKEKLKLISKARGIKPGKIIDEMIKGEW